MSKIWGKARERIEQNQTARQASLTAFGDKNWEENDLQALIKPATSLRPSYLRTELCQQGLTSMLKQYNLPWHEQAVAYSLSWGFEAL